MLNITLAYAAEPVYLDFFPAVTTWASLISAFDISVSVKIWLNSITGNQQRCSARLASTPSPGKLGINVKMRTATTLEPYLVRA